MKNSPVVFVIIVTYNGKSWIDDCLKSTRLSTVRCQTIILDNASNDNTADIVRRNYPECNLIELKKNHGFGVANNIGIRMALDQGAEYVFLLNQDAYLLPDTLEKLTTFLDSNKEYKLATPLHCSPDTNRLDPTTQIAYLQKYCPEYLSDSCLGNTKEMYRIRGINAAAWLLTRDAIKNIGGFDPLFFMYGEDDDLINRFEFHGYPFALIPSARIVHLRGKSIYPKHGFIRNILLISNRLNSNLLVILKNPSGGKLHTRLVEFVCHGMLYPTVDFLIHRKIERLFASYISFFKTLIKIQTILNSAKKCKTIGSHFL